MSFDLQVYGAEAAAPDRLADLIGALEGLRFTPGTCEILRRFRGKSVHLASLDGPHRVEAEDLPDAVRAAALGITTLLELHCPFTPASGIERTKRVARTLAKNVSGVVYDPQEDRVVWPRGSARKFTTPKEKRIEVVELTWFVRRADGPDDLPEIVFDTIAAILPEALPRRFGTYEPPPFRLDEEGREGFLREWRARSDLFWFPRKPFFYGSTWLLGAPEEYREPPPVPMGRFSLSLHRAVLADERWRREVRRLFVALAERTRAFFAIADVERNVHLGGGRLGYGGDSETPPSLFYGRWWMGLPGHEFWMAWLGKPYRDLLAHTLVDRPEVEEVAGGVLVTTGEEPPERPGELDFARPWFEAFPPDLAMTRSTDVDPHDRRGWEPVRAVRVPDGL